VRALRAAHLSDPFPCLFVSVHARGPEVDDDDGVGVGGEELDRDAGGE